MDRRIFNKSVLLASGMLSGTSIFWAGAIGPTTKGTDIHVVEATYELARFPYRAPMKFGGRVVTDAVLLNATVKVESRDGRTGVGTGSMLMGNIWAWPAGKTEPDATLKAMLSFGEKKIARATDFKEYGHPLEWTHDYATEDAAMAAETVHALEIQEVMPVLAQRVAASPLEAAVFDAYGKMLKQNAYNLLSEKYCNRDLSAYLDNDFRGEYLDRYTSRGPKRRMPLYHLVGALDPLTPAEVMAPVGDGLPEHYADWIPYNGLTHTKIKLNGDNLDWDVNRTLAVHKVTTEQQQKRSCTEWFYSTDFNERAPNEQYLLDYFEKIRQGSADLMDKLQYVEQPTHRDLKAHPENTMHRAARIKPVVIDESLVCFESLLDARRMGYSGIALKACKGHGDALLMGAVAQKYKMFLCVQDLTCPGASFLHSASLSARIPTVAGIEGNARQYIPAANEPWVEKFPTMFITKDGTLGTGVLTGNGLY